MNDSEQNENRLIAERRGKLERLRESGNPYPNDFRRASLAAELVAAYSAHDEETLRAEDVEASVAGRMMAKRVMGKNSFVKVQDRSGQIQLFVQRDALGEELYGEFKKWDIGDIVGARGRLMKTKTGEVSIAVSEIRLLTKSLPEFAEFLDGFEPFRRRTVQ